MEAAIPMNTQPYVEPGAREAERQYAMFNHIVGIASVASWGVPLLGFFAVMAMWLIRKADSPYLDDHGREAMNFQISLIFYYIILMIPLSIVTFGLWALFVPVLNVLGCVLAAMAAHKGQYYRYPMTIRFIGPRPEAA